METVIQISTRASHGKGNSLMLYSLYTNETNFRDQYIWPLLNRLGFSLVATQHGSQEFGKDFVFSELHRLGGVRHYAAQVKHEKSINQGIIVDQLLSQTKQAFATPFRRPDSPRDCHVSGVYIFNSGTITPNARDQLLNALRTEHYGDNVHLLDGERLESIDRWSTLQSDAISRSRLLGLRACLRAIIWDLNENHLQGKETLAPIYVHGIELFLSEPVNVDDRLLGSLYALWQFLQGIERLQTMYPTTSANARKLLPNIKSLAESALPRATEARDAVDRLIASLLPPGAIQDQVRTG